MKQHDLIFIIFQAVLSKAPHSTEVLQTASGDTKSNEEKKAEHESER